jgi:hypothetical protein
VVPGNLKEPESVRTGINTSPNCFVDVFFFKKGNEVIKHFAGRSNEVSE